MKNILKTVIKDFHKNGIPKFRNRAIDIPINSGKIVSLIGPRRAGKTYLLYQLMSNIPDITDVIYINFEDERLQFDAENLNLILEAYYELYPDKKEIYLFFDEIQEVNSWEKFVRRLYDSVSKQIFITGSSSKLLNKEIATGLRGRTVSFNILPLSFKEYSSFKDVPSDLHSTKGKAVLIREFKEYMEKGGFPEIVNADSLFSQKILQSYLDVMIFRDLIERHEISNITALKYFVKKALSNCAKEFSVHKVYNELKSQGIKISKDSIYEFIDFCEDAFILSSVSLFSESIANQTTKKIYSIDIALSRLVSFSLSKDLGRILENIVQIELTRKEKEIYYFRDKYECDFIIKEKDSITEAFQVCLEFNDDNEEREIEGLKEAMNKFKLKKGIILTLDEEKELDNIKIIPVWKWLME